MIGDVSRAKHIYIVCGYTDMRKAIDGLTAYRSAEFWTRCFFRKPLSVLQETR